MSKRAQLVVRAFLGKRQFSVEYFPTHSIEPPALKELARKDLLPGEENLPISHLIDLFNGFGGSGNEMG